MNVFTYSEARQNLYKILILAQSEEIEVHGEDGSVFSLKSKKKITTSPFDVPGVKTMASTQDILDAVRDSRMR